MASQKVVLTVPAQPEFLRVVRMTASGLGNRIGFTIDEVDDLKLALDELCFAIIGKGSETTNLRLTYEISTNELTIHGEVPAEHAIDVEMSELSQQILSALVDEHQICSDGSHLNFTLRKLQATATS